MLYYFVRPIARLAILLFFKKIYISNLSKIPRNKAVILAPNHPTAFMEPCMMAVFMQQPLHALVRGDFFQKPLFNFLLRALKMVPIYRIIDLGYKGLKNNYATFEACYAALSRHQTIMIFPEGNTTHEKRLRPLQKGLARIVAGAFQQYPDLEEIYVVPIGVNFTYADQARREALIDIGDPIPTRALFEANSKQALTTLTRHIQSALEERVVVIQQEADEELAEHLLQLDRSTRQQGVFPIRNTQDHALRAEKAVTDTLNQMDATQKALLWEATSTYFKQLEACKLEDWALLHPGKSRFLSFLFQILGFIPAILGRLFYTPPMSIAWYIRKTKVERPEFFAPILLAASMGTFFLYYIFWILAALITGKWIILMLAVALGILGMFDMLYREELQRIRMLQVKQALHPDMLHTLQTLRSTIKRVKLEASQG